MLVTFTFNSQLSDDYNRVVLEPEEGISDCDYINASYVDVSCAKYTGHDHVQASLLSLLQSLVQPKAYIVTQGPTETTIGDFWRMVWQEKSSCIVMVTRTFDFIRVCSVHWPSPKQTPPQTGLLFLAGNVCSVLAGWSKERRSL